MRTFPFGTSELLRGSGSGAAGAGSFVRALGALGTPLPSGQELDGVAGRSRRNRPHGGLLVIPAGL